MTDDMQAEPPKKEPMVAHPTPALIWRCPWEGCNSDSAMPGAKGLTALAAGASMSLTCRRCGNPVVLKRPDPPRIITPTAAPTHGPNRAERRAAKRVDRKRS